uniref:Helicase ATP-binding domain-containing protein n=1 Tax=Anopheles farauti TaxID=69004 RepID=A0A182Q0A5_9DIPT
MPIINANGMLVQFPYEPYDVQKTYIEKVVKCLILKRNGMLESPSGSGKTLSLFCPILSWMEQEKTKLNRAKVTVFGTYRDSLACRYAENFNITPMERAMFEEIRSNAKAKIIYASSSYSLLSKAKEELEKTCLPVRAVVLGSRDQLCQNTNVKKVTGDQATKASICHRKVMSATCSLFKRVGSTKNRPEMIEKSIMDIEDLITVGGKLNACPYYLSKEKIQSADVLFVTHEYLFKTHTRKSNGLDIRNSIIILDEAHNVAKICEESYSTQIRSSDVALAISEITLLIDDLFIFESKDDMLKIKKHLVTLDKLIKALVIVPSPRGEIRKGTYIFRLLEKVNFDFDNIDNKLKLLIRLATYFNDIQENAGSVQRALGLQALINFLKMVYAGKGAVYNNAVRQNFRVYIEAEEQANENQSATVKGKNVDREAKVLNFMCVNPGYAISKLTDLEPRNIILTSSTLSPMKPLISELMLPVKITLENPHFVDSSKFCVKVVSFAPNQDELASSDINITFPGFIATLGCTVLSLSPVISGGLVIFFPSYHYLNVCKEGWKNNGMWAQMNRTKSVFVEPYWTDKKPLTTTMNEYYASLRRPAKRGAIFMAACPGPVPDQFNFSGVNCRAIIIFGIPSPLETDTRVVLKKEYLDMNRTQENQLISGNDWLDLEAFRAVNHVIRRIVCHKDDYGAILLCDIFYGSSRNQAKLSSWMQSSLRKDRSMDNIRFGRVISSLANFYRAQQTSSDNTSKMRVVSNIREERKHRAQPASRLEDPMASTSSHCKLRCIETVSDKSGVNDRMETQKETRETRSVINRASSQAGGATEH